MTMRCCALSLRLALCLGVGLGCSSGSDIKDSVAKLDQHCTSCEYCCTDLLGCCRCGECMDLAYDRDAKQVLKCLGSGRWEKDMDCPGGGRVWCEDGKDLHISCKDTAGKEWYE